MKERELWDLAIEALDLYFSALAENFDAISTDEAVDEVTVCCGTITRSEEVFLKECAAGVARFDKLCEGALKGYCNHLKRNATARFSMYLMAYILIFRYEEVGFEKVRKLFSNATITPRIVEFVNYLLDKDALMQSAFPIWLNSYDREFLEECVLEPLCEIKQEATVEIVDWFQSKGLSLKATVETVDTATSEQRTSKKKTSELVSPSKKEEENAVKKTRLPPAEVRDMIHTLPEPRPAPVKCKPGEVNGVVVKSKKPATKPVGFSFLSRTSAKKDAQDLEELMRKTPEGEEENLRVPSKQRNANMKKILEKDVDVRSTNAALKREAFINNKRATEEQKRLMDKEFCLADDSHYETWRAEQLEKAEQERQIIVLERHIDEIERAENLKKMKAEEDRIKQEERRKEREESTAQKRKRLNAEKLEKARQKGYVEKFRSELQKGRTEAVNNHIAQNIKSAEEVKKENEALLALGKEKEEEEKNRRAILIEEIRLLNRRLREQNDQRAASTAPRDSDDGLSLLDYEGLRRELENVRMREKEEEEKKRKQIQIEKEKEKRERNEVEDAVKLERERRRKQRENVRQKKALKEEENKKARSAVENAKMLELHEKLEAKRKNKRNEMESLRDQEKKNQYELILRSKDITALEQERWKQLEEGAVNRVVSNQNKRSYR